MDCIIKNIAVPGNNEENNEVFVDVILSNGLIDTRFALLVCCPAPLCPQRKVPAFYPSPPEFTETYQKIKKIIQINQSEDSAVFIRHHQETV